MNLPTETLLAKKSRDKNTHQPAFLKWSFLAVMRRATNAFGDILRHMSHDCWITIREQIIPQRCPRRRSPFHTMLAVEALERRALLSADVVLGPAGSEFVDLGLDPNTGEVIIVGTLDDGGDDVASVFYLDADRTSFTSEALVGLGPDPETDIVQVFGISSDGSRIAGVSQSDESEDVGEGTTWLSSDPDVPAGTGFFPGVDPVSTAVGAWSGGVVGDFDGGNGGFIWDQVNKLRPLDGHDSTQAFVFDVSSDGEVQVGNSTIEIDEITVVVATYWDSSGIHPLEDPFGLSSDAKAISPNGDYIGGVVAEFIPPITAIAHAAVWDSDRNLILLTDENGDPFEGTVLDISNQGYAVGMTLDGKGFIWHESFDGTNSEFNGPQIFDFWLENIPNGAENPALPTPSKAVVAVAEDLINGKLVFAVEGEGDDYFVQADLADIHLPYIASFDPGFTAVDLGLNAITNEIVIVGMNADSATPEVTITSDMTTFNTHELIGLGPDPQVFGVSEDGTRIAGVSKSPGSIDVGEGTTWMTSAPDQPIGTGFFPVGDPISAANDAFPGGTVGLFNGGQGGFVWTTSDGLVPLAGHQTSNAEAVDVTMDGGIQVGFSTIVIGAGGATYWDADGIHALPDPFGQSSGATSVSPNGDFIGGDVFEFVSPFEVYRHASMWDADRNLTMLKWADGTSVQGVVVDVTNSGYGLIELATGGGAIAHPDGNVELLTDFVPRMGDGTQLSDPNDVPVAISEDANGDFYIAFESFLVRLPEVISPIRVISGTDGDDDLRVTLATDEVVHVSLFDGNDKVVVFADGDLAELVIDSDAGSKSVTVYTRGDGFSFQMLGGIGTEHVRILASDADNGIYDVATGEGGGSYRLYLNGSDNTTSLFVAGGGHDQYRATVLNSDDSTLVADLGEGQNNGRALIYGGTNVRSAIRSGGDNASIVQTAMRTTGAELNSVAGDGNHRIYHRNLFTRDIVSSIAAGEGRSRLYDLSVYSTGVAGAIYADKGKSSVRVTALRSSGHFDIVSGEGVKVQTRSWPRRGASSMTFDEHDAVFAEFADPRDRFDELLSLLD